MAMNKTYLRASDLPTTIPLFPLAGAMLLPGGQLPLNIFEPRYLAMFDDAMRGERIIGMIQPAEDVETPAGRAPGVARRSASAGRITQLSETGDGRYFVMLSGIARFRMCRKSNSPTPYRQALGRFRPLRRGFRSGANRARRPEQRTEPQRHRL